MRSNTYDYYRLTLYHVENPKSSVNLLSKNTKNYQLIDVFLVCSFSKKFLNQIFSIFFFLDKMTILGQNSILDFF